MDVNFWAAIFTIISAIASVLSLYLSFQDRKKALDQSKPQEKLIVPAYTKKPSTPIKKKGKPLFVFAVISISVCLVSGTVLVASQYNKNQHSSNKLQTPTINTPVNTGPYLLDKVTPTLDDTLQDNKHNLKWNESPGCQFTGDGYHVTSSEKNYTFVCAAYSTNFSNFMYEVQMTIIKGEEGGLIFRANADKGNLYYFGINVSGDYTLIGFTNHGSNVITTGHSLTFHTGLHQLNLIAVSANSDVIKLYANKSYLTTVKDGTFNQGQIGVATYTADTPPSEVVFDNVKVSRI